jgi:hypothetical protein
LKNLTVPVIMMGIPFIPCVTGMRQERHIPAS